MTQDAQSHVTEEHLLLFGTIIQCFARHEVIMQQIMATVSGADVTSIRLLTSELSFTQKREALFNLLRHRAVPSDQIEQIRSYLQLLQVLTPLRNDIAHSVWTEGKPQNSIWPLWLSHGPLTAVKPLHDIGGQTKEFIEDEGDKVTYTLNELKEICQDLTANSTGLWKYAVGNALVRSSAA